MFPVPSPASLCLLCTERILTLLLLTSAGPGQSPSTAHTAARPTARLREAAEVVDALTALQRSVPDLEVWRVSDDERGLCTELKVISKYCL